MKLLNELQKMGYADNIGKERDSTKSPAKKRRKNEK